MTSARFPLLLLASVAMLFAVGCGSDGNTGGGQTTSQACAIDADCPSGQQCVDQVCKASFVGGDINTGGGSDTAAGTDATTGQDSTTSTDAGGQADTGGGGKSADCAPCQKDAECAEGYACVPLLNSTDHNFCVKLCDAEAECGSGMICQQATTAQQKFCIPPTFKCEGCAVSGCKGDESCDFTASPPVCIGVGGACAPCQIPKDCGEGLTCVKQGDSKICAPSCGGGATCPANSTCATFSGGITACSFAAETCCFGDTCAPAAACSGCAGKCVAGKCVECLKDSDCDGDSTCLLTSFTCTKATCPAEKPQKLVTGECVECTNDTHCAASSKGPKCIGNACSPSNQNNECSVCKDPYPGCVEINGTWSCVECSTDDDCSKKGKGSCSAKTYTCSGTTQGGGPTSGSCKSDADCPAGTTGFVLACDTASGLCYDTNGQCDNLTAFCNAAAGSVCKPFDALGLGGGGLPQIPGLPGGGGGSTPATSGAGVCSCGSTGGSGGGWDDSICKALSLSTCDCAKDSTSKACDPLGLGSCCQQSGSGGGNPLSLLACMSALQGGKPDPACFGGKTCLDMSCLTAMMGGGGSTPGVGGGYCSDGGP